MSKVCSGKTLLQLPAAADHDDDENDDDGRRHLPLQFFRLRQLCSARVCYSGSGTL
jgi:hypothetical protein